MKNKFLRKFFIYIYIFFSIFTQPIIAASIVVDQNKNQQLHLDKTANGKQMVNINAPNEKGTSHNFFKEYNVGKDGVILNNSNKKFENTQLGGLIYGNPNLVNKKEADKILAEVTGTNRSKLEGFTEIAGKQANFILSNPNGIFINGAGFINTPQAILTTGKVVLDKFKELKGFDIEDGTIVIGNLGLDTRNIRKVDLISRTAELEGAIYGGEEVNVILGRNEYDYTTEKVTAKSDNGEEKPKIALDGKALGSLYAGRIYIHSSEKGVGVNSEATLLADTGDLTINADGDLVLKDIQAKKNIDLTGQNISIKEKAISEKEINLVANKDIINTGNVSANEKINLKGQKLENKKDIIGNNVHLVTNELENKGTIYGENDLTVTNNKITNDTKAVIAGSSLNLNSNTIENKGNILGDNVILKGKDTKNTGSITGEKELIITSNLTNTGNVQGKDKINITGNIENNKNIKTENELSITGSIDNKGYIYGKNTSIKGKVINTGDFLTLTAFNIYGDVENFNNLVGGDKLVLISKNIKNKGTISAKDIEITTDLLNNYNSITGESTSLKAKEINNYETIYGKNYLYLQGENFINNKLFQSLGDIEITLNNTIENTGDLFAKGNIQLKSTNLKNDGKIISEKDGNYETKNTISNSGILQGNSITLNEIDNKGTVASVTNFTANSLKNSGTVSALKNLNINDVSNEQNGKLISGKDIITKNSLNNSGILSAKGNIIASNIINSGNILTDNTITFNNLTKNSGIIEGNNINIENTDVLNNSSGTIKAFNDNSTISIIANNLINSDGKIQSQGNLTLNIFGDLTLEGTFTGNNQFNITANSLVSNTDIENNGDIILSLNGNFVNNKTFISGKDVDIKANNISNSGTIGSVQGFLAKVSGTLHNLKNLILGSGENNIIAENEIKNEGFITSEESLKLDSGQIKNLGQIASGNQLTITSDNNIENKDGALIFANKDMSLNANKDILNEKSEIYSGSNIVITANENVVNKIGDIEGQNDITITASNIENIGEVIGSHEIKYVLGKDLNLDTSKIDKDPIRKKSNEIFNKVYDEFVKEGRTEWENDVHLYGGEKVISNYTSNLSYISAGKNLTLNAKNNILNKEGNILAVNDVNIKAKNLTNETYLIDITTKAEWRQNYEMHGDAMYKLGYNQYYYDGQLYNHNRDKGYTIVKTDITWKVGSDKPTLISAGGKANIDVVETIGNGTLSNKIYGVDEKHINTEEVSLNESNIQKTGTINTEEYTKIPTGDKGLFKVNEEFINNNTFEISSGNNLVKNESKPGFSYLIETNIKFIDKGFFLGSDYFFDRINFNPEKNIRLLGDEFFETKFVNRAILESTGKRYLNGATNDKEQMQILYDNSIVAMKDMNLSIGIALTAEQINNLKDDIIWYVEEEVNGVNVLVPKVYLSKETLASLGDNQTGIYGGDSLNISALAITNTGKIQSTGDIIINTDELLNKSILGDYKAKINGNNINIVSVGDINNIGAEINAENNLSLESLKGSIANKTILRENVMSDNYIASKVENSASMTGDNISINANKDFENTGALVKADNNLDIEAENITANTIEVHNYHHTGGTKNYTINESLENFGSSLEGTDIVLNANKDINIKGSNIVANNNLNLSAGDDVNIVASVDTNYYEHQESKKKSFGRSKSKTEVKYSTKHNSSNLIGENINITSGKDTAIIGSNIQAGTEGKAEINAGGDIVQAAVKDINYSYKKTTKKGFLGLTGSSKSSESYKEEAIKANTISGTGGTTYVADKGLMLEGVTVVSTGNVTLKGKDVNINPTEEKSFQEVKQKKKGFSSSFGSGGISLSYGKSKDEIKTTTTENIASNIVSQGKVTIEANDGTTKIKSSDIYGNEGIDISGTKGVELTTAKNTTTVDEKHKSTSIGISAGVQSSIKNTIDNIENIDDLTDFSGNSYDIANTASDLVGAIKDGADAIGKVTSDIYKKESENSASENIEGVSRDVNNYISVSAGISKNKSESHSSSKTTVKNNLESSGDINISSSKGSVLIEGTDIKTDKDLNLKADKDIIVQSSKDEYNYSNKSSSSGISVDLTISTDPTKIFGGITTSHNKGKGTGEGIENVNSKFEVGGTHRSEAGETVKYEGANVEANKVDIKGKDVIIASSKDISNSESKNSIGSVKFGTSPLPTEININYSKADGEKEWVGDQTSIIAKEGGTIESKNFTNSGAIIGSESKENKLIVKADNVNVGNLKDKDTNKVSGGGINITNKGVPNISVITGGQDKRQDTNATAVNTEFIVQGENKSAEELGFNTDLNKAQVITKDENKVLDADLHTDLLDKDERDKIVEAGQKIKDLVEATVKTNDGGIFNTYKENRFGNLFNEYIENTGVSGLLSSKNISLEEKGKVLNDIVIGFLTSRGYTGPMPEIRIGENTFAVDSKNSSKLNERKENPNGPQEIIYISKNDLTSSEIMQILGHELGHLATYDKDQKTADNIESKIDKIEIGKDGDYTEYLASLKDKYNNLPSLEEALQREKQIPNEYKEELVISTSTALLMAGTTIVAIQLSDEEQRVLRTEQARKAFNEFKKDFEDTMEEVEIYAFFAGEYLKKYADDWNVGYNGTLNQDNFLELPESLKDRSTIIHENLPPNTGNLGTLGGFDLLPEDDVNTKIPPTKTDEGKEFEGNIVDPLPEPIDKDSLTTADKNPPKVENNHILFISEEEAREKYKVAEDKITVDKKYPKSKSPSAILRDEMLKAGIEEPEYQNAAHHIVIEKGEGMPESKKIFEKLGIDINSAANGVFLPTTGADNTNLTESPHVGRTGKEYKDIVEERITEAYNNAVKRNLNKADTVKEVTKELSNIKNDLLTGKLKINNAKL